MRKEDYQKMVKELSPKPKKIKNIFISFFVGGTLGFLGEILVNFLMKSFSISNTEAYAWLCVILIFLGVLFTGIGFFDKWFSKCKCGLIIPTTGFAHSVASSALDYKRDGLITGVGSNIFKLAGSVILYGVVSSFLLVILKVIIYG